MAGNNIYVQGSYIDIHDNEVRGLFWGDSSMAVVFCVCRDCYGYADNMSQFEREFGCKAGVVSNTFGDNPYMRMPLANWKRGEVKQRVLQLVDAYKKAVVEAAKK